MAEIYIIIGVSGSGKTTIGKLLSQQKNIPFFDADDFHSVENKTKMKAGIPLNDEDREEWLKSLNELAIKQKNDTGAIIACSGLKEKYRRILVNNLTGPVYWVVLIGEYNILHQRMEARKDHYMPPGLLSSQLSTMEYPPYGIHVLVDQRPEAIIQQIIQNQNLNEFGIMGLGVMGKSLARNLGSKGVKLSLFNQHVDGKEEDVANKAIEHYPELVTAKGFEDIPGFVQSLALPRKIFMMVPAGPIVDSVIAQLKPHLVEGDIVMDGGNSHYKDTERRQTELIRSQIQFIGIGVSGGEKGALEGPAIMPGGDVNAYQYVSEFLNAIAAKDHEGKPCNGHIGPGGSGHFVKMIHNGMEYAEMQLISEVYWILKTGLNKSYEEIAQILEIWQERDLSSYLIEITIKILRHKTDGVYTLDQIADIGGSKGTGGWSLIAATELGVSATMMADALFARYISALKQERILMESQRLKNGIVLTLDLNTLEQAFILARWINHHQGISLMQAASSQYTWNLNLAEITRIWTNGCIIRSGIMESISESLTTHPNILMSNMHMVEENKGSLKEMVTEAQHAELAIPGLSSALNYLFAYTTADSPMNLIQAQRDFFGAHTYRKTDDPFGKSYHTEWEPE
jgi:6-phosphogluconate dehydrogenase